MVIIYWIPLRDFCGIFFALFEAVQHLFVLRAYFCLQAHGHHWPDWRNDHMGGWDLSQFTTFPAMKYIKNFIKLKFHFKKNNK